MNTIDSLVDVCKTYYTGSIGRDSVIRWLLQFGTPSLTEAAIGVLSHVHFIDNNRMVALVRRAVERIPAEDLSTAVFSSIGKEFDSSALVGYGFAKQTGWEEDELAQRWIALSELTDDPIRSSLILLDDNLASGTQLQQFFSEMLPTYTGEREHMERPLGEAPLAVLRRIPIYVCIAAELGDGAQTARQEIRRNDFQVEILSGHSDRTMWLEYGGPIWKSPAEAEHFQDFARIVGRILFADKDWEVEKLEDRLLGYGSLQKLTVFAHNAPKSLVPLLWKYGKEGAYSWVPLFPERKEWLRYEDEMRSGQPAVQLLASMVASGSLTRSTPACSVYLQEDGEPLTATEITIGSAAAIQEISHRITDGVVRKREAVQESRLRSADDRLNFRMLSLDGRSKYNKSISKYNREVDGYVSEVCAVVDAALRLVSVDLRVYNEGTATANEVVMELLLPDDVEYRVSLPCLPKPPEEPRLDGSRFFVPNMQAHVASYLSEIRDEKLRESASVRKVSLVKDRGKRILKIFLGKVLASTFRDYRLQFLQLPRAVETVSLHFRLFNEETSIPTEGVRTLMLQESDEIPSHLKEAWLDG